METDKICLSEVDKIADQVEINYFKESKIKI